MTFEEVMIKRYSMNNFVIAVGVSFLPLHEEGLKTAEKI